MSRWITFALSTVSVLALALGSAPVTQDAPHVGGSSVTAGGGGDSMKRIGNWCC